MIAIRALILVSWSLAAMPALCTAGVLAHGCDCDEDLTCSHECPCANDPCSKILAVREDSPNPVDELAVSTPAIPDFPNKLHEDVPANVGFVRSPRPPGKNLPCPPGSLPLLL